MSVFLSTGTDDRIWEWGWIWQCYVGASSSQRNQKLVKVIQKWLRVSLSLQLAWAASCWIWCWVLPNLLPEYFDRIVIQQCQRDGLMLLLFYATHNIHAIELQASNLAGFPLLSPEQQPEQQRNVDTVTGSLQPALSTCGVFQISPWRSGPKVGSCELSWMDLLQVGCFSSPLQKGESIGVTTAAK